VADAGDVARLESAIRDLARDAAHAREERSACDAAIARARDDLERANAALLDAERLAKEYRRARHETVRGRAELEHRRATILESEGLTRSRAERAEGLAHGYRGAASFATIAATEAEAAGDAERAGRERSVAERAARACAIAESRAAEERAEERKLANARAELDVHLAAEREVEATNGSDRIDAELRAHALHETIAVASAGLRDAEAALARAGERSERIAADALALRQRLRDATSNARGAIEERIVGLRRVEREAAAERLELERTLATLREDERRAAREAGAPARIDGSATPVIATTPNPAVAASDDAPATMSPASLPAERRSEAEPVAARPPASIVAVPERSVPRPADDELIPGLIGLLGTIFSRRGTPPERPRVASGDESTSIADRIARDFGWIGEGPTEGPLREEVRDLEPERLGREGL
jgi:hypothetical protein